MTSPPQRGHSASFFLFVQGNKISHSGVATRFQLHDNSLGLTAWNKALSEATSWSLREEYPVLTGSACYGCRRGKGPHVCCF